MTLFLRPGRVEDFEYCKHLYFSGMETILRELNMDLALHASSYRQTWDWTRVRIITLDEEDIGWLQCATDGESFHLGQLFVDSAFQRRGIGTEVMHLLIAEATSMDRAMTLGVVKSNPALRLYQRLGFSITHEDDRKFHMRRSCGIETPGPESGSE